MSKKILIDASHAEERRTALIEDGVLSEFDHESSLKKSAKGNVYLGRVSRVEPSLQAAFVDFGDARDGFLAFGEVHPDYYRIPVEDKEHLIALLKEDEEDGSQTHVQLKKSTLKNYKIQEVMQKGQLVLVQMLKDPRAKKGAALTTFLSFPGRYCVLMPNTPRGGGVSKRVTNATERKRLKTLLADLTIETGMGLIVRTAGMDRTKTEIKRDYQYLLKEWEQIKARTVSETAPALIYEEGDLITKTLRDLYTRDVENIWIAGEGAYNQAKSIMKKMIPSHTKKICLYEEDMPIFRFYDIEDELQRIYGHIAQLSSGGSLVFGTTEALTAIDVNSGRSTKERHIEDTALKTNLEAAKEVARQLRLRDLGGLIVIDFIDMDNSKHKTQVEKALNEAVQQDRARIQLGSIGPFGLLEMSRQRLKPSLQETVQEICEKCQGTGVVPSLDALTLSTLREIEKKLMIESCETMEVPVTREVALYILNNKYSEITRLEAQYQTVLHFVDQNEKAALFAQSDTDPLNKEDKGKARKKVNSGKKDAQSATEKKPAQSTQPQKSDTRESQHHQKSETDSDVSVDQKDDADSVEGKASNTSKNVKTRLKIVSSAQRFGHRQKPKKRPGLLRKETGAPKSVPQATESKQESVQETMEVIETIAAPLPEKKSWWHRLIE